MSVKSTIRTVAYGEDRAVKLTKNNGVMIQNWIIKNAGRDAAEFVYDMKRNKNDRIRVKVKGKGWRVAHIGDTIVKHVEGKESSFCIVKAE